MLIREEINRLKHQLYEMFDPSTFTYRPGAVEIEEKIFDLQDICKHNFVNGKCVFCDKEGERK